MEANNNEEGVKLKFEVFTNLFSTSMFKVAQEIIDEKTQAVRPVFAKDKNENFEFVDDEKEDFDLYHAEDEFGFAKALDFLKGFSENKIGLGLIGETYVKINVMLAKVKAFLGIEKEKLNENPDLTAILDKLKSKDNQEKYRTVIKNIYDLRGYAGKLDGLLNKKIESTENADLMKISTEIKEAYLAFQDKIKDTLNLMDAIIDSLYKKREFSEVLNIYYTKGAKYLSATEKHDHRLFVATINICDDIMKNMKSDEEFYNENKKLFDTYNESLNYVITKVKSGNHAEINKDILKRLSFISQFCISYFRYKSSDDVKKATLNEFLQKDLSEDEKKLFEEDENSRITEALNKTIDYFEKAEVNERKRQNKKTDRIHKKSHELYALDKQPIIWKVRAVLSEYNTKISKYWNYSNEFESNILSKDSMTNEAIKNKYDEYLESVKEQHKNLLITKRVRKNILSTKDSPEKRFYKEQIKLNLKKPDEDEAKQIKQKIEKLQSVKCEDYDTTERIALLDTFVDKFSFDNQQLFYAMIDDEIDVTKRELEFVKNKNKAQVDLLNGIKQETNNLQRIKKQLDDTKDQLNTTSSQIEEKRKSLMETKNSLENAKSLLKSLPSDRLRLSLVGNFVQLKSLDKMLKTCQKKRSDYETQQNVLGKLTELVNARDKNIKPMDENKEKLNKYQSQQNALDKLTELVQERDKNIKLMDENKEKLNKYQNQQNVLGKLSELVQERDKNIKLVDENNKKLNQYQNQQKVLGELSELVQERDKNIKLMNKNKEKLNKYQNQQNVLGELSELVNAQDPSISEVDPEANINNKVVNNPDLNAQQLQALLELKKKHKIYFWLREKYESLVWRIFLIGFVFGFVAWVMRRVSKDINQTEIERSEIKQNIQNIESKKENINDVSKQNENSTVKVKQKPELQLPQKINNNGDLLAFYDKNTEALKELGFDNLKTLTSKEIAKKINDVQQELNKLQEQIDKNQNFDSNLSDFYNKNQGVLQTLDIDFKKLKVLKSDEIAALSAAINQKVDALNKQIPIETELNQKFSDFIETNQKALKELGIAFDNLKTLTSDRIANKINDVQQKLNKLQKQIDTNQSFDSKLSTFYKENQDVLQALDIDLEKLKVLKSGEIETQNVTINQTVDNLKKQMPIETELNKEFSNFIETNKQLLNELKIDIKNLSDLSVNDINKKIEVINQKLNNTQKRIDNVNCEMPKFKDFISKRKEDIERLKKDDKGFQQFVDAILAHEPTSKLATEYRNKIKEKYKLSTDSFNSAPYKYISKQLDDLENNLKKKIEDYSTQTENHPESINSLEKKQSELKLKAQALATEYDTEKQKLENDKNKLQDLVRVEYDSVDEILNLASDEKKDSNTQKLENRLKQLNSFYTVRRALEQQAGLLNANKYVFNTLNNKLLKADKNAIKGKTINELLIGEEPILKTNYLSKDNLEKIKEQQTAEDKKNHGQFNTVLRYDNQFLKEGSVFKSYGASGLGQDGVMGYHKKNADVFIDEANKNNIMHEIALFFGFDCIVTSDVIISDGNSNILMMDNALKDNRKIGSATLNEEVKKRLQSPIDNSDTLQKLWDSTTELAFIDIVLMQFDRNPGNFTCNESGVLGIDNDGFAVTSNGDKAFRREYDKYDEINKLMEGRDRYSKDSIKQIALAKMPVISTKIKDKILAIDKNDLEKQLNLSFADDINRKDKVESAIKRFNELCTLIKSGEIEACEKISDEVISKIEARNAIVYAELLYTSKVSYTNDKRGNSKFLFNNQFLNILNKAGKVGYYPGTRPIILMAAANQPQLEKGYILNMLENSINKKTEKDVPLLENTELDYVQKLKNQIDKEIK